jgi:hypothetical protein
VTLERANIQQALQRKGFEVHDTDHIILTYVHKGKKTPLRTKMSRGSKGRTLGDPHLGWMSRQLRLTKKQFMQLVECTLDQATYVAIMIAQGHLPKEEK